MMFIWVLIIAVAVSNIDGDDRINIGGQYTTIDRHPSLVQVEFRNALFTWTQACAGTIITKRHIISAAHCFDGILFSIHDRRIRAGSTIRNFGGVVVDISSRLNHPTYELRNGFDGDISIVQLGSDLTFSSNIHATMIVDQGFVVFDSLPVKYSGWGAIITGGGGGYSAHLRHVEVSTINHRSCIAQYKELSRIVTNNMICSKSLDVFGGDACASDDGGPLYFNNDILVGVVSWGHICGDPTWPRVNTKISSYSNWIHENIA